MSNWYSISALARTTTIHVFDEIGKGGCSAATLCQAIAAIPGDHSIELLINSPGGSVFDGFALHSALQKRRNVTARVEGLAASMATIVMLGAGKVIASENATIMIHDPRALVDGTAEEMRTMADLCESIRDQIVAIYAAKSRKPTDVVLEAMKKTTWFSARQALAWGLVDEIGAAVKIAASFDLSRFAKPAETRNPKSLAARDAWARPGAIRLRNRTTATHTSAKTPGSCMRALDAWARPGAIRVKARSR